MKKVITIAICILSTGIVYAQQTTPNLSYNQVHQNNAVAQSAWQTIQESNSRASQVIKQTGHQDWRTTVNVVVQSPGGTPSTGLKYMYSENANTFLNNNNTTVDYGIRQVDIASNTSMNELRSVDRQQQANRISVFPNPSTDGRITVGLANSTALHDIHLISMSGVVIDQWRSIRGTNYQLNSLASGSYILKIINRDNGQVSTEKIIVSGY